ncbi:hypothetical protein H8356DRAFT_1360640 [Neocallimastix lanati (nom. inval.)]|nr:hypothetical protein H8356DRAFT_1360640 [Neocallimastix sp. JGI-2020a]
MKSGNLELVTNIKNKESEMNRSLSLEECMEMINKKLLKRLTIGPEETFLISLRETTDRDSISVIDYENALRPRAQIYKKMAMDESDTIEKACSLAV